MKYKYKIAGLKQAYKLYLEMANPRMVASTINTWVSNAFWLSHVWTEQEFMDKLQCDDYNREELIEELTLTELSTRKFPEKDAKGYIRAFDELRKFISLICAIEAARKREPRCIQLSMLD